MKEEMLIICAAQMYQMRQRLSVIDFGDAGKNILRDEFCEMARVLHSWPIKGLDPKERLKRKQDIEELSTWMHLLMSSNFIVLPSEMEYVIRLLLQSWIGIGVNDLTLVFLEGEFGVTRFNKDKLGVYQIGAKYGVNFTKDPVFVGVPRYYKEDILSNIALFHEIGHIVDNQISLVTDVKNEIEKETGKDCGKRIIREYFPLLNKSGVWDEGIILNHIKEYIADLFGAQYLGEYIIEFVDFVETVKSADGTRNHQPFENRKQVVNDFLSCMKTQSHTTSNHLLQYVMQSFHDSGRGDLCIRWHAIKGDDLLNDRPIKIACNDDMYSLFRHVWDVVFAGVNAVENVRQLPANSLSHFGFYDSYNKRVMESIATFRVNNP